MVDFLKLLGNLGLLTVKWCIFKHILLWMHTFCTLLEIIKALCDLRYCCFQITNDYYISQMSWRRHIVV
jgi:hypothetical protein